MPNLSGLWTLDQQMQASGAGNWPILYDPYFYDVAMLVNGNGTNGAQNNTFRDSSTNNYTITRGGNTTQGTFSPYGNLWSNYFDGSSYLTFPEQTFSGDFTIEFWFYQTAKSSYYVPAVCSDNGGYNFPIILDYNGSGYIGGYFQGGAPYGDTGAKVFSLNTWTHIAVSRSGSAIRYFVNGSLVLTMSGTTTLLLQKVGGYSTSGFLLNGYLSNVRVTNTALYTSNFTPSTTPLTAVSGTSLLTCQSNRFIDNSSNAFALTVNGTPSAQRFSPFNPTTSYDAATIGGSGVFDGTGDYIATPNTSAGIINSASTYSVEFWVRFNAVTDGKFIGGSEGRWWFAVGWNGIASGKIGINVYSSGGGWQPLSSSTTPVVGAWYHVAFTFDNGAVKLYINGVQEASSTGFSTNGTFDTPVCVGGAAPAPADGTNGYISDFRVIKGGSLVYTGNFAPPTAPLAPVTNTQLLTSFTNAGIPDAAMQVDIETKSSAQISTTQSKYGGSSLYFDGSGSYLALPPNNPALVLGTSPFTIECWVYGLGGSGYQGPEIVATTTVNNAGGFWVGRYGGTWYVRIDGLSNDLTYADPDTSAHWQYVTVTRDSSNVMRLFINGTIVASGTRAQNATQQIVRVGSQQFADMYGYMNGFRITKGYARYTANFTPPTAAFQTY